MLGDARLATEISDHMLSKNSQGVHNIFCLEKGIYVIGFSFPVVPMGK